MFLSLNHQYLRVEIVLLNPKIFLENNVPPLFSKTKLVSYIFDTCLKLGSPARDNDVKAKKLQVLESLKSGAVFAVLVPLFF